MISCSTENLHCALPHTSKFKCPAISHEPRRLKCEDNHGCKFRVRSDSIPITPVWFCNSESLPTSMTEATARIRRILRNRASEPRTAVSSTKRQGAMMAQSIKRARASCSAFAKFPKLPIVLQLLIREAATADIPARLVPVDV